MKTTVLFLLIPFLAYCNNPEPKQIVYGSNKQAGNYIHVNDIKIYYEIYGKGEPLLLMHGNSGSIENFVFQIPELSKYFKVIAVDSRAQGRSTDSEKEITYALMASDMAELIDKLKLGSVYVLGWSDGGNNGLELAYAYPEKVRKLIIVGANYTHENQTATGDNIDMDPYDSMIVQNKALLRKYSTRAEKLSPNPEKLPAIKKKLSDLMTKYPNFTPEQLRKIKTPTLVVAGDHDLINMNQTITLFNTLPNTQLFIVPGATHIVLVEQPTLVNRVVISFFKTKFRNIDRFYFFK
jgi:pimeloyl-ACP methyl ester carboxylesterase